MVPPKSFAFTHTRGPLAGKREKPPGAIPGGDLMDTDLARMIVDELASMGVSVTWTGGGEPTLHPDFDAIIAYGAKKGLKQAIYTHGGHIDGWRAELLKRNLTFVYVSLDAADAEAYKRDKGVNRFYQACTGIQRLAEAPGDATVGVGFLVTERNWRDAAAAATLARDLGADYLQLRPTILYRQDDPDTPDEATGWMEEALPVLERLAKAWDGFVVADLDRFRMYRAWEGHGYPTCWWSALQTCVTPNGKVWTCVNKREHPGAEVGDLTKETFAELWSRRPLTQVNGDCRVMCRGHLPNLTMAEIMAPRDHEAFV